MTLQEFHVIFRCHIAGVLCDILMSHYWSFMWYFDVTLLEFLVIFRCHISGVSCDILMSHYWSFMWYFDVTLLEFLVIFWCHIAGVSCDILMWHFWRFLWYFDVTFLDFLVIFWCYSIGVSCDIYPEVMFRRRFSSVEGDSSHDISIHQHRSSITETIINLFKESPSAKQARLRSVSEGNRSASSIVSSYPGASRRHSSFITSLLSKNRVYYHIITL